MYQVRSEVFIYIVSFDFDSNLVKDEGLLHEVQVAQVVVENGKSIPLAKSHLHHFFH